MEALISNLKPYSRNAKKHSKQQIDLIAKSIKEFGFRQPIVIDKNKEIIIGHARLEAAKQLGLKEVPVIDASDLTPQQVKALRLADNKLAELAQWDMNLAIEELKGLDDNLIDLTGFDRDLLIDIKEDEFDAEAEYAKISEPKIKKGELWQLGEHRVYCGDSTEKVSYEAILGQKRASLIFTDPPYNVGYNYDWCSPLHKGKKVAHRFFNDKKTDDEYEKFIENVFRNGFEFTTEDANFYCWYASKHYSIVENGIKKSGWKISQQLIWMKNYPVLSIGQDFHRTFEPCLHGWKKKHFYNKIGNYRDIINWDEFQELFDIWFEKRDKLKDYKHPTQKPVRLAERAIKKSSKVNDIVIDFFGGSGSTLIACEQLKRKAYLIELDPIYTEVIINRYENFTGNKAIKVA